MNGSDSMGEARLSRRRLLQQAGAGMLVAGLTPGAAFARGIGVPKPSVEDQKKVGRQAAGEILRHNRLVNDSRAAEFSQMGARLVAALPDDDRTKWDFDFHVIDSRQVNAFALPGGPMFMYTGLYEIMTTLDALAAVTGHEMTHVRREHWAKAYQQAQNRKLAFAFGLTLLHASQAADTLAGLANNAIGLKYSRGEEDQADEGGLINMVDAGFNPEGMIELFTALQKISGNGGGMGGDFLSDHPLTSDRIKHTKDRIAAYGDRQFPPLTSLLKWMAPPPIYPVPPPPPGSPPP